MIHGGRVPFYMLLSMCPTCLNTLLNPRSVSIFVCETLMSLLKFDSVSHLLSLDIAMGIVLSSHNIFSILRPCSMGLAPRGKEACTYCIMCEFGFNINLTLT